MKRAALIAALCLAGCSTVHQQLVTPKVQTQDDRSQKVMGGYIISAAARKRYNDLIGVYGNAHFEDGAPVFVPTLRKDYGITPRADGTFYMIDSARTNFAVLTAMKAQAFPVR